MRKFNLEDQFGSEVALEEFMRALGDWSDKIATGLREQLGRNPTAEEFEAALSQIVEAAEHTLQ